MSFAIQGVVLKDHEVSRRLLLNLPLECFFSSLDHTFFFLCDKTFTLFCFFRATVTNPSKTKNVVQGSVSLHPRLSSIILGFPRRIPSPKPALRVDTSELSQSVSDNLFLFYLDTFVPHALRCWAVSQREIHLPTLRSINQYSSHPHLVSTLSYPPQKTRTNEKEHRRPAECQTKAQSGKPSYFFHIFHSSST